MMDCFITLKPNTLLAFLFILYIINRKGANQGAIVVYTLGKKIVTPAGLPAAHNRRNRRIDLSSFMRDCCFNP